jgi:hypothetical protein
VAARLVSVLHGLPRYARNDSHGISVTARLVAWASQAANHSIALAEYAKETILFIANSELIGI